MEKEKPWKINANSFLVLYSILAAVCGVFIALVFQSSDTSLLSKHWYIPIPLLVISLGLFIFSAEALTDALDEDDVKKYLAVLVLYNFAVFCLLSGLFSAIYYQYIVGKTIGLWFDAAIPYHILRVFILIVITLGFTWHWVSDICWLAFKPKQDFQSYIDELCGDQSPIIERKKFGWSYIFLRMKNLHEESIVFAKTTIELKPSTIVGVGVFAVTNFEKDEVIAEGIHANDYKDLVSWDILTGLDADTVNRIHSFCIGTPVGFFPPPNNDFEQLTVEWYMNHSCKGNVGFNTDGDFVAMRKIHAGEELTYDYGLAEANPTFTLQCSCGYQHCRKTITGNNWKDEKFREKHLSYMLPKLRELS